MLLAALIGGGVSFAVGSCGGEDRGSVEVEGSTTGAGTSTVGTTTAPVTFDTTATDPAALDQAMARIAEYARTQTSDSVAATVKLQAAIDAGSVARAKVAYAAARPYYERIEPLVALFPELDGKIDAREDAFPEGRQGPEVDRLPSDRAGELPWTDEKIDADTKRLARLLVADSRRLDELMQDAEVTPEVVIPGVAELVDEVEESKITGEEERYSKLDLPTFLANLEGSRAFYAELEPLVEAKDPELEEQIDEAFDAAFAEVEALREGGDFVAYDDLDDSQQRAIKQTIEALAEPLARVQGTLGVES